MYLSDFSLGDPLIFNLIICGHFFEDTSRMLNFSGVKLILFHGAIFLIFSFV
jgi:hypothetical protein